MVSALEDLFAQGVLTRPSDARMNLVHIVRAVATATGAGDFRSSPRVHELLDMIGDAPHLIFVLLDGLGMSTVRLKTEPSVIDERACWGTNISQKGYGTALREWGFADARLQPHGPLTEEEVRQLPEP